MKWTDLFIRRPVLSLVVSALVLIFGLKAIGSLPVNQYPETQNAVVTITTAYYGADPETIAGFITNNQNDNARDYPTKVYRDR